jgi:hypothetical protein
MFGHPMKTQIIILFLVTLVAPIIFNSSAFADEDKPSESKEKVVEFEGILRLDNDLNPDENGVVRENLRFQKFEMQATVHLVKDVPYNIAKEILFVVRSRMEQDVIINGVLNANHLSVVDYLKEAYIKFTEVGGLPVAVVVGTSEITYGQDYDGTLSLQNDVNHAMSDPDRGQVKGFTVTLDKNVKNLFDKVEAGFFTSNGDITKGGLNHFDGFSFRVTRELSENLTVEASTFHKGNGYDPELKPESALSFGGIYRNGRWTIWSELFGLKNSEAYPNASLGGTVGVSRTTGPGRFVFNATGISKTLHQYAFGYDFYVSKHWTVGPTLRYTSCVTGEIRTPRTRT